MVAFGRKIYVKKESKMLQVSLKTSRLTVDRLAI